MAALFRRKRFIVLNNLTEESDKEETVPEVTVEEMPISHAEQVSETIQCPSCKNEVDKEQVKENKYVCYECGNYFRVRTSNRIRMVVDHQSFEPWFEDIPNSNPLNFPEYDEKLLAVQNKTHLHEGVTVGRGMIKGEPVAIGVCDARFLMGSMGHVVGEKIASAVERATEEKLPIVLFCCSGGARMQEGIISLMQMAKTSAALKRHSDAGLLYVPVLTDPTTGGVTASFAMLGDIILAEPKALIGFAGPRVIEQTIGQKLPDGFQRSEFLLEHGFIDKIVERKHLRGTLHRILELHHVQKGFANFVNGTEFEFKPTELMKERSSQTIPMTAWEKVKSARRVDRPASVDYMSLIFEDFMEFHGDRYFRDDPAIVSGIAYLDGQPVTVIGVHKGKDMKECQLHNYGMPSPEGYRKALRLMKQAEKFNRPIITFVNTSGAFCGMEAEEGGQGEAIARNLYEMSGIKVPILCLMIGEGGSGGALALAVGNEVWMMENATYSVLSPEGFASILWKDGNRANEAADVMKITAQDLLRLNVVDEIIPEFGGADSESMQDIALYMKYHIRKFLVKNNEKSGDELAMDRYQRFRRF